MNKVLLFLFINCASGNKSYILYFFPNGNNISNSPLNLEETNNKQLPLTMNSKIDPYLCVNLLIEKLIAILNNSDVDTKESVSKLSFNCTFKLTFKPLYTLKDISGTGALNIIT